MKFPKAFSRYHVTPATHPRVVDLFTGDGSIAKMIMNMGWQPDNITCIDQCISPTPVVQGVHWEYMYLHSLAHALKYHLAIPSKVEHYRHAFDVVMEWLGYGDPKDIAILYKFFARPGGYIFKEGIAK